MLLWRVQHEQPAVAAEFASAAQKFLLRNNTPGAKAANRPQPERHVCILGIQANLNQRAFLLANLRPLIVTERLFEVF